MSGALEYSLVKPETVDPPEFVTAESYRGPYLASFPRGNQDRDQNL